MAIKAMRIFRQMIAFSGQYFGLLAISLLLANSADADQEDNARQQLELLSSEMVTLRKMLGQFKSQRSELQNTLRKSELEIGAIQGKIRRIQQQLKREQSELANLQQQRKILTRSKQQQQKFIQQQILAAYQIGQQKKLKVLLNQEQPEKISRALTYYDYFNQARSEQIESYITIIDDLNSVEPKIQAKTQSLSKARKLLGQQHQQLLAGRDSRQQSLLKINSAIQNNDQRLKKMNKDRAELERLLDAVEQTLANISIPGDYQPFNKLKGKLPWPVNGKPSNSFGKRRNGSDMRWQGLAIPATEGSQVTAIHHGRVVFADWLRGSGLLVIIDHGNGYMSLYAHNQSLLKETGDWVNPSDLIATVGNSGGQKNASLYFEIRHNGKPTDPTRWCKRA
ncbi:MAG: septal ring factor EnvC (AmiA/AmiB activator) [Oceanicoccus sp.]|jgi:septal ring factor EnvC (AmiA/AmiB activator)